MTFPSDTWDFARAKDSTKRSISKRSIWDFPPFEPSHFRMLPQNAWTRNPLLSASRLRVIVIVERPIGATIRRPCR